VTTSGLARDNDQAPPAQPLTGLSVPSMGLGRVDPPGERAGRRLAQLYYRSHVHQASQNTQRIRLNAGEALTGHCSAETGCQASGRMLGRLDARIDSLGTLIRRTNILRDHESNLPPGRFGGGRKRVLHGGGAEPRGARSTPHRTLAACEMRSRWWQWRIIWASLRRFRHRSRQRSSPADALRYNALEGSPPILFCPRRGGLPLRQRIGAWH
jgi:hypothetical protein